MSDDINELMEAFLSICLEQRQISNEVAGDDLKAKRKEELKNSSNELAQKLYTKAAELERSGEITKAMELYNRAYRLDPEIDRHIDHEKVAREISKKDLSEVEPFYNPFRKLMIQNPPVDQELWDQIYSSMKSSDKPIIGNGEEEGNPGVFRIAFKEEKNLLNGLPEDLLDRILESLGWQHLPSLEIASRASKQLYLACRQSNLWKRLCALKGIVGESDFDSCWRLDYIMRPNFRTDGIYISKITYIRQGYQESAISQPSHLVTYYRYLRFFSGPATNGKRIVMALVSTDKPIQIIEMMKDLDLFTMIRIKERFFSASQISDKSFKSKKSIINRSNSQFDERSIANLFIGTYWPQAKSSSDRLFTLILFDAHSKNPMRLKMSLELADFSAKGVPSYRTAKCLEYCGRVEGENQQLGDPSASSITEKFSFDIHNWGKFYFSRVKSY